MSERHVLYRVRAADGVLLYVGATTDPGTRMRRHHLQQPWWGEAASITLEHFATWDELMEAERQAIETEGAVYNVIHSPHAVRPNGQPRRPRGAGSVYQRADGMWIGSVSTGTGGNRIKKTVSSRDRAIAEQKLAALMANG